MAANEKPQRPKAAAKPAAKPVSEGERIAKVLSRAGISSRREAERLIEAGEVTVNGKIVTSPALNVTASDKITVSGQPVGAPEPARLWLYYKPEGLVTSAADEKGRDTVFDNLPEDMPRVMSIGRLDLNSEGLLLLTNDGTLKRQLELPSTGWLRKYRVRVKGNPTDPDLEPLRRGITIDGERFQPMDVRLDRHQGANAWLTVGLREGKNREIRRAMFAINLTVNRLIRISYGPFRLNEMQPGDVEEVKARILRDQLGALMVGLAEDETAPAKRPLRGAKPAVRTSSRTRSAEDDDARPAPRPATRRPVTADDAAKPAVTRSRSPRPKDTDDAPRAKPAPSGSPTTQRGRKALGQLADAWGAATKPARRTAKDRVTLDKGEGETAPKPRGRSKPTAAKPSTRNAAPSANRTGKPAPTKPTTRRK